MNILFICTGNTCRSCMAEAIFNSLSDDSDIIANSAGLAVVPGSVTSDNTCIIVKEKNGVDLNNREAVQLTEDMIEEADLILTMTYSMKDLLINLLMGDSNRIFCINEYIGLEGEILDPYGGDIDVYEQTYDQLKNNIILLLKKIKEDIHN
ncbi:low molecular weight protein arginine phosphatase [Clostridium niameyense]|uniref:Low molecular weight protein arginine phosphatase n=1 Tax=Clostridium niameyense TaxID=1622073 RepID=A0A6M0RB60_9CLOT|nr:low molecular weight protein arginine phosphatase [Clostridium niameyense]NEZ47422.1 low molecular weight protein arginine phosphatase [Clostridium niameyense]